MGFQIGSDTALMRQAARAIEAKDKRIALLEAENQRLEKESPTCPNCGFTCNLSPRERRGYEARIALLEAELDGIYELNKSLMGTIGRRDERIAELEAAIRKHRNANWEAMPVVDRFDQQLYAVLQEQEIRRSDE
jgi:septal ring factor EnvC (AmiA/AmiB activator)